MFYSLIFKKGYPAGLNGLKKRKFEFHDRLNMIIGPNGSGKSTLVRALRESGSSTNFQISNDFYEAEIEKDDEPFFSEESFEDIFEEFHNPPVHFSTGENRINFINRIVNKLEKKLPLYTLKSRKKSALLLDEADTNIGFMEQSVFWRDIVPELIKRYQLIMTTHSILPLLLKKDNIIRRDNLIELRKGYYEICLKELSESIKLYRKEKEGIVNEGETLKSPGDVENRRRQ